MRLVSWNINSLRARIGRVQAFLERHDPDILCLQETKVQDAGFPRLAFMEHHITPYGQPTYNGVAVLSKEKPDEVLRGFPGDPTDHARVLAARFGDLWVYNLYVVNGKHAEDPAFLQKREWMAALQDTIAARHDPTDDVLLLGDFNITPTDLDSHGGADMAGQIHHTADERAWLQRKLDWGLTDLHRQVTDEQVFTWWDYRNLGFQKNEGLRIDLALGTASVADRLGDVWVDREERKVGDHAEKPSDHAPLVVDLS